MIAKSKKKRPINGEMFHSKGSSGWYVLNFLKEVETNNALFIKKERNNETMSSGNRQFRLIVLFPSGLPLK